MFLDNIIVWAPSILYFKGLGMRILKYEIRICQKSHNKVTKYGSNFYESDVSHLANDNMAKLIFFFF